MKDEHLIIGGGPVDGSGSAPEGQDETAPNPPAAPALSTPLLIVHLSPEGFLEVAVNIPPDGGLVRYHDAAHVLKLHAALRLGHAMLESLLDGLPLSATKEGEQQPS